MMLDEIAAYLEAQGLGVVKTTGNAPTWPIYKAGTSPADNVDEVIIVAEGPGADPIDTMGNVVGAVVAEVCSLVVQTRSLSYPIARTKAQAIWSKLHKLGEIQLTGVRYLLVMARQSPFPMGRDDKTRWLVGCNYEVTKELS